MHTMRLDSSWDSVSFIYYYYLYQVFQFVCETTGNYIRPGEEKVPSKVLLYIFEVGEEVEVVSEVKTKQRRYKKK